jgi:hypothetical protein
LLGLLLGPVDRSILIRRLRRDDPPGGG